ncbi:MAG: hypothetical protein K9N62_18280 [Verrucomicrobia bacterium]|nr:hypothetical protein [Verrucomicrobiota bacterium]
MPFPDAWIIPPASDPTTVVVIDPQRNQITEMKPLRRIAGNKLQTMRVAQGTLDGEGLVTDWQEVVDYGAYVTESAIPGFKMIVADKAMPPDIDRILSRIVPHLQVITNNGPGATSGGGTPRRINATPALVSGAGATP